MARIRLNDIRSALVDAEEEHREVRRELEYCIGIMRQIGTALSAEHNDEATRSLGGALLNRAKKSAEICGLEV